ncbi:MAG: TIGR01777 family oxidoreductase [Bacteroidota bacterium]|nr:TIGR01777 family oxidoreductase [Bacteroidota bacterium]
MAKVLITGGSGLLGKAISEILLKNNYEVAWLSREEGRYNSVKKYKWDVGNGYIDERAFDNVEHIIHLAGAGIADKKWTIDYKAEIINSRIQSSELLYNSIKKLKIPIKTFVGASAVGFYGARSGEELINEHERPVNDFLSRTCVAWESSYTAFKELGIRTPIIRIGVVLSNNGGAYKKMLPPFKCNLGCSIGSGKQYFPWIHINDIANIFVYALENQALSEIYNGTGTEAITMNTFSKQLAKSIHRFTFLPNVPKFLLKLVLGESHLMITEGLKISNKKIKDTGFKFKFEKLSDALEDLAKK